MNTGELRRSTACETLSDVAALSQKNPAAVTLCVENEFATREDGLPGMEKAYGMKVPSGNITQDGPAAIVYTQAAKGTCAFGEVFTTDGRIKAMDLHVLADDKHFFPNYNVAPEINAEALKKYPAIAEVLAPVTKALNNTVAQELNAQGGRGRRGPARGREGLADRGGVHQGGVRRGQRGAGGSGGTREPVRATGAVAPASAVRNLAPGLQGLQRVHRAVERA